MAGIVAGRGGSVNGLELSGVAKDASIVAVQVFSRFDAKDSCGNWAAPCALAWPSDILRGLEHILTLKDTYPIAAINMSVYSGTFNDQALCNENFPAITHLFANLRSVGIAPVVASGNDHISTGISWPACVSGAISVGATTKSDTVAPFSNSSPMLSILAPGVEIWSSVPGGGYDTLHGTSMAAPHVASAIAILRSQNPSASIDEIMSTLTAMGVPVADPRNGLVRARLRLAKSHYLLQGMWRGDEGWVRRVPIDADGFPSWGGALDWLGPLPLSALPGSGAYLTQSDVPVRHGTVLLQALWREEGGYLREVPIASNGTPDWVAAKTWNGPLNLSSLPGSGPIQTQSDVILGNGKVLVQGLWRGNEGFSRTVPLDVNGFPSWFQANSWFGPFPANVIPGNGNMQTQSDIVVGNGSVLLQSFWRGDQGWFRMVPLDAEGNPNAGAAGAWQGPLSIAVLPGNGALQTQSDVVLQEL